MTRFEHTSIASVGLGRGAANGLRAHKQRDLLAGGDVEANALDGVGEVCGLRAARPRLNPVAEHRRVLPCVSEISHEHLCAF